MTSQPIILSFLGPFHEGLVQATLLQAGVVDASTPAPSWERQPLRGELSDASFIVAAASLAVNGTRLVFDLYKLIRDHRKVGHGKDTGPDRLVIVISNPLGAEVGRIDEQMSDADLKVLSQAIDDAILSGKNGP